MAEAPAFGISDCHSELVDAGPGPPKSAVDIGAFTELCEQALCQLHITVDLPQPRAFVVHGVVFNEPPDILRRVADEQSHLMRKFAAFPEASDKVRHTLLTAVSGVACLIQKHLGQPGPEGPDEAPRGGRDTATPCGFPGSTEAAAASLGNQNRFRSRMSVVSSAFVSKETGKMVPVLIPASVGAHCRTRFSSDMALPPFAWVPGTGVRRCEERRPCGKGPYG